MYEEFKKLGMTQSASAGFALIDEEKKIQLMWSAQTDSRLLEFLKIPLFGDEVLAERYAAWKNKKSIFSQVLKAQDLKNHLEVAMPADRISKEEERSKIDMPDPTYFYFGTFKQGYLQIISADPLSKEHQHLLVRFARVFEQSYTRFSDLKKAEAQAREAQIEAALEKVRAKTASMYKSTELEAVVSLVFQQLRLLDFDSKQCIIGIIDKETLETEIWQSVDAQSGLPNSYKIPKLDHPFIQEGYEAYLKGEQYHERELSGAAKKSYDKLIFEQTDLRNVPTEVKAAIIQNEKIVTGSAYMSHGVIQVIGAAALSAEKAHILQRFAAAIDLTYTRFLDIQKAEQQKIQLEKVFSENQRLLHSILPEQIAEQIRQGQQTVVKRFEQVSILFADIVGFTVLSDRISPQEVVDILNGLFSKFDDLTDK